MLSLAFWVCLLIAASLYALVVLSPKAIRWAERADAFEANQQKLLGLRDEIELGERLAHELTLRMEQGVERPDNRSTHGAERLIVVEEDLRFRRGSKEPESIPHAVRQSLGLRVCAVVAESSILQSLALVMSAGLLLIAFSALMDTEGASQRRRRGVRGPHGQMTGFHASSRQAGSATT